MFGETVLVREIGDTPVVCRVWEVTTNRVYVCTEDAFNKLKEHKDEPFPENCFPVAFPKEDVFHYNSSVDMADPALWRKLSNYV